MLAWMIVLLVLLLILAIPLGADAAYGPREAFLKLKIGPFRKTVLPGTGRKKPKQDKPQKPKTETPAEEKPAGRKIKLTLEDFLELAEIALKALRRFNLHLSVDLLELDYTAASADPYGAVVQYGRVNAFLGAIAGPLHRTFLIRREDVRTGLDFEAAKPAVSARLVLSIQVWEILLIAVCAGASGLRWYLNKKRAARADAVGSAGKEPV